MRFYTNQPGTKGAIKVTSTSRQTATASPILLRDPSGQTRLAFEPILVNNDRKSGNSVEGRLIYEKKSKNDELFPSERQADFTSKRDIRVSNALEIALSTSETKALYDGLENLYQVHEDMEGIQPGTTTYVPLKNTARTLLDLLRSDDSAVRMLSNHETFDLVRELLKLLAQGAGHEELSESLRGLGTGNLQRLSTGLNLTMLEQAADAIESNMTNSQEEYWQSAVLKTYPWIISQVFSAPCAMFQDKAYVSGKTIDNRNGNVVDFLYQNKLTGNVALIEIKTPCTELLGQPYRNNSYSISRELSGAVTQVLSYRHSLMNDFAQLQMNSNDPFEAFSPNCVIIAGNTSEFATTSGKLNRAKISSFENFRNSLNGLVIVTYDELLQKIKDLISILRTEQADDTPFE